MDPSLSGTIHQRTPGTKAQKKGWREQRGQGEEGVERLKSQGIRAWRGGKTEKPGDQGVCCEIVPLGNVKMLQQ